MVVSFGILLYYGREIYVSAPPIPAAVKTTTGETLFTREQYDIGRQVWQRVGGHQMGSIWGHGSYVAPDWSADWLHREATALLDLWAQRDTGKAHAELDAVQQAGLQARTQSSIAVGGPDNWVPVIEIRAAVIVGAGSAAYEVIRDLVYHLPVMVTPKWVQSRSAPIALENLLAYLVRIAELPEADGQILDAGGRSLEPPEKWRDLPGLAVDCCGQRSKWPDFQLYRDDFRPESAQDGRGATQPVTHV